LRAAPDTATVQAIARRWGFWHTGEFAAAYRRLFGELPSQTRTG
jgi:AraC family ethanolamine operon transcriptional activator